MLQNVVLFYGVSLGHEKTVRTAASKFSSFMADPVENKHFTGDLKDAVYLAGIKAGGVKEWNFLWTRFLDENTNSAEKYRIMNILAYSKNLTTLEKFAPLPAVSNAGYFTFNNTALLSHLQEYLLYITLLSIYFIIYLALNLQEYQLYILRSIFINTIYLSIIIMSIHVYEM